MAPEGDVIRFRNDLKFLSDPDDHMAPPFVRRIMEQGRVSETHHYEGCFYSIIALPETSSGRTGATHKAATLSRPTGAIHKADDVLNNAVFQLLRGQEWFHRGDVFESLPIPNAIIPRTLFSKDTSDRPAIEQVCLAIFDFERNLKPFLCAAIEPLRKQLGVMPLFFHHCITSGPSEVLFIPDYSGHHHWRLHSAASDRIRHMIETFEYSSAAQSSTQVILDDVTLALLPQTGFLPMTEALASPYHPMDSMSVSRVEYSELARIIITELLSREIVDKGI